MTRSMFNLYGHYEEPGRATLRQERRKAEAAEINSLSEWVIAWLFGLGAPLCVLAILTMIVMVCVGVIRMSLGWGLLGG